MWASLRLAIQVTPCMKALLSPPTAMGSHVPISNYSGVWKATQSTSISTNENSQNKCTGSSSSTPNSSPQSFTKLSGLDGHAITPSITSPCRNTHPLFGPSRLAERFSLLHYHHHH